MADFDLYDVLGDLGYGLNPHTRKERAAAFTYKHTDWLAALPPATTATLKALAGQFAQGGTESLENPDIFRTPEVVRAGGIAALKEVGEPRALLQEANERIFAT